MPEQAPPRASRAVPGEASSSESALTVGDFVEIHGLQSAQDLNGLKGRIVSVEKLSPSEPPTRYGVRLQSNGEQKSVKVKRANLRKLEKDRGAATDARKQPAESKLSQKKEENDVDRAEGLRYRPGHHDTHDTREGRSEPSRKGGQVYEDEAEYPDIERARTTALAIAGTFIVGFFTSRTGVMNMVVIWVSAVVLFLVLHIVGCFYLSDCRNENRLLILCATFGMYGGIGLKEFIDWTRSSDGVDDSAGPWSLVVCFACVLYLHNYLTECSVLPPDTISGVSLFFPVYPAYSIAVVLSCIEYFAEWKYLPEFKIWSVAVCAGGAFMAIGQYFIWSACRTAGRNFWASCRNISGLDGLDDELKHLTEECFGLEIPDRRVVAEGLYRWERHPAYLGAILWGVGVEVALCNPIMLLIVSLVMWSSLFHVLIEEEEELYDEFPKAYAQYASLTYCWIPAFHSLLEDKAFQREMVFNAAANPEEDDEVDDAEEEPQSDEDGKSEDEEDMLPSWEGVRKGGALWNRQFREPWVLG